jgi:4-hydroxybenzoate polyprenyltransferase
VLSVESRPPPAEDSPVVPGGLAHAALEALRPRQWAKNVFLFPAIVFAMRFADPGAWWRLSIGVAAFSLLGSTGYIFNDARDVEADRRHPEKKNRPIASGRLAPGAAYAEMAVVFAAGIALAASLGLRFLAVALLYFVTTISYSFYFKHLVILDVMFLSACYLWRVVAGAVAVGVTTSPWLLACTGFLALFIGFNKRRGEILLVGRAEAGGGATRKNLAQYTPELIVEFQAITTSGTIITYALYTLLGSPTPWMLLTLPCVLYGIFRYIYLVGALGEGGSPDETLLRDRPILATGLLYGATAVAVLWLHGAGHL